MSLSCYDPLDVLSRCEYPVTQYLVHLNVLPVDRIACVGLVSTVIDGMTDLQWVNVPPTNTVEFMKGQSPNFSSLIHGTLTRVCIYLACWHELNYDIQDALSKLNHWPKPWDKYTLNKLFPTQPKQVKSREVMDFDVGSLVGVHADQDPVTPTFTVKFAPKLEGLEHFSQELLILEALLPLYLENYQP